MEPDFIDSILSRANELLESGKPAETLRCLEPLDGSLVDADDRIEFGTLRAWALSEVGRIDEALEALEALLDEFPESSRLHGTRGVVLSNADELDEAREELELAVKLDVRDDVALANLALVYERMREYKAAIELYDRAITLGADIDWALQRKATALTEIGDFGAAKVALKRYLSLVPDDANQWISLAILHSDDEEYELAFDCYRKAETLEPESPLLRLNWGVTAVRAGQIKQARRQLRRLQKLAPASLRPRLLKAMILEEEGNLAAADQCYRDVLTNLRADERGELFYALEMSMDFYGRQHEFEVCDQLMATAYSQNACSVELCEAYREAVGEPLDAGYWFSLVIEADFREGLPAPRMDELEELLGDADDETPEHASDDGESAAPPRRTSPGTNGAPHKDAKRPPLDEPVASKADRFAQNDADAADSSTGNSIPGRRPRFTRFLRNFQVLAQDRDEAVARVLEFARKMGEQNACIREFVGDEPLEEGYRGIYEVEEGCELIVDEAVDPE